MSARPYIFVRTSKVASTTIRAVVGNDPGVRVGVHASAARIRAEMPNVWEEAWTFGFTRNPWDRVVSLWHYRGRPGIFREWVLANRDNLGGGGYAIRAWDMLSDGERVLVDYVGRYEQLEEDLAHVCQVIGRTMPRQLRVTNAAANRRPHQDYYDAETRETVARAFAQDIEAFGYDF